MGQDNARISEVQLEMGCRTLGIPLRRRDAAIVYEYEPGVAENEQTGMSQLSKLTIKKVYVRPDLVDHDVCDVTPLLSREELSTIGDSLLHDLIHGSDQVSSTH